jgi:hypothetical protein
MNDRFDDYLKGALPAEVDAPQHAEGFDERLWARIASESAEAGAPGAEPATGAVWPRRCSRVRPAGDR